MTISAARLRALVRGDIRVQFSYGFYFLYAVFCCAYIALLSAILEAWKFRVSILLIFTDPAAMGLFFMGAIILYEKSQRIPDSIAVSPVDIREYVFSKIVSIGAISLLAAGLIAGYNGNFSRGGSYTTVFFLVVVVGSTLFTLLALCIAAHCHTLNQFMLLTIPAEIVFIIPPCLWVFGWKPAMLALHPSVYLVRFMLAERFQVWESTAGAGVLILLLVVLFVFAVMSVRHMNETAGGIRL